MRHVFPSTSRTKEIAQAHLFAGPKQGAELDGLTRGELPLHDPG
ncbi:hypothetical protein [Defluviimonas salinarum]|uniref:Uncharacterized protein n=1 Tax=Defluviimonas salinarum TaxID=2992147 RepID=A0ABT3J6B0_9RHOB|nr:hypothetical protein [Defluviimonas salinarum]MCW3782934.1 hypothetical protein [Defluviimonas salinarum]